MLVLGSKNKTLSHISTRRFLSRYSFKLKDILQFKLLLHSDRYKKSWWAVQGFTGLGSLVEQGIGVMTFAVDTGTVLLNDFSCFTCLSTSLAPTVPFTYLYCKLLRDPINIILYPLILPADWLIFTERQVREELGALSSSVYVYSLPIHP